MSLYVCATPIGNLDDASFRLISTLNKVNIIAAEDTRNTGILLSYFNIDKPIVRCDSHKEKHASQMIISKLESGLSIALVSDAGTPNISDPGALLVKHVREAGFPVIPIPGPCSISTIMSVSGQLGNRFFFAGFFPKKRSSVDEHIAVAQSLSHPTVWFETSKRLLETLEYLLNIPVENITLGKELTKKFEKIMSGSVKDVLEKLNTVPIKGEWVMCVSFGTQKDNSQDMALINQLKKHFSANEIKKIAGVFGKNKNQWYKSSL